jgi:hypothetical protein
MSHDVFISYSSRDKSVADAACAVLEGRGIRCWIAPRDVTPGVDWSAEIIDAIHSSRMMVLVYSSGANESPQIKRELERAVAKGIPIVPFRIEDVPMSKALEYFISSPHWLDALTPPLERHLDYLARTVQLLLSRPGPDTPGVPAGGATAKPADANLAEPASASSIAFGGTLPASTSTAAPASAASRTKVRWIAAGAVAVAAVGGYALSTRHHAVDGDLVGKWGMQLNNQAGAWQSTFAIAGDGAYRLENVGHDRGHFTGMGNSIQMVSATGTTLAATYRLLGPTSLEVTSAVGTVTWTRRPDSPPPPPSAPMAGLWDAHFVLAGVGWAQTIENAPDGGYSLTSVTGDSGYITASAGQWHMVSRGGHETDGTYRLVNGQTLSFTGPLGASVWTRSN